MRKLSLLVVPLVYFLPSLAHAYVGPGASAGNIALVLGVLAATVIAFVAVLWYPARTLINKIKASRKDSRESTENLPASKSRS